MNRRDDPLHPSSTDFCVMDYPCAYLPDRTVRMFYRYVPQADPAFVTAVVRRGWRRFGYYFFHPICQHCTECKSLRIRVSDFSPSRSQRRIIRKNKETQIRIRRPGISREHLELYHRYHSWKARKDGWKHRGISQHEYAENFVEGAHEFGKEVLYFRDGKLVGVDLIDFVEDGISAIYFFHDPDYAKLSLGTYSLLYQIDLARQRGLEYIYLGYWVEGCRAFAYKPNFAPQEILEGFPALDDEPSWRPFLHGQTQPSASGCDLSGSKLPGGD